MTTRKQAKMDAYNALPYLERVRHIATGHATVGTFTTLEDDHLKTWYVGRVRGGIVGGKDGAHKFTTRAEALQCAKDFIAHAKAELP